jgi:hypothetical protein
VYVNACVDLILTVTKGNISDGMFNHTHVLCHFGAYPQTLETILSHCPMLSPSKNHGTNSTSEHHQHILESLTLNLECSNYALSEEKGITLPQNPSGKR